MSGYDKKVPKLRFPGFSDEWEERKLGDYAEILTGGTPKTSIQEYWEPKEVPWMSSGEVNKRCLNETDNMISKKGLNNSSARWVKEHSVLIALAGQGKTRGTVAINNIPLTTNQSIAAIVPDKTLYYEFVYQDLIKRYDELRMISSGDGTRGGLNKQIVSDVVILCPSYNEQVKIGSFFADFDRLITLHQRKLDHLQDEKKSLLQKMFPKNGTDVPEIRFSGFTDAWEQRKLGDEFKRVNERNDGSFVREQWISVAKMYFQDPEKVQSNNIDTRTYVMREGDIAFEGHPNADFKFGRFVANDIGPGVVSELFPIYRHKDEYDNNYWKHAIQLERIMAPIFAKSITSSGNSSNKLDQKHFLRQSVYVPSIDEQHIIGDFFNSLDNILALHQRKLNHLQEQKKSLLQQMFV